VIVWQDPAAIPFQTPLSDVQLNATVLSAAPVPVPIANVANITGIASGTFNTYEAGFDGNSWAYAEDQIGSSITWNGIQFPVLPADQNNVVAGGTVPLPAGQFGTLLMLGDMVNDISPSNWTFTVNYTDGTFKQFPIQMSDWVNPRNYPGETIVKCYPRRHFSSSATQSTDTDPNSVCVYGYSLTLDPSRTVASLTLPNPTVADTVPPNQRGYAMISFMLLPPPVTGTLTYNPAAGAILPSGTNTLDASFAPADPGAYTGASASVPLTVTPPTEPVATSVAWPTPSPIIVGTPLGPTQLDAQGQVHDGPVIVPLVPSARVDAFYPDGTTYAEMGFNEQPSSSGNALAYSADQLGTSLSYAGFTFPLGPASVPDAATSATIPLPVGNFSTLYMLGAAANGAQQNQPFTVTYDDQLGPVTTPVSLSSWDSFQNFQGESVVKTTNYANNQQGAPVPGTYNVYGYSIPLDPGRLVQSLTMPPNLNVTILALGLGSGTMTGVPGTYVYNPPAGTVLPLGENPLSVLFTPSDTTDLAPKQGQTTIDVVKPTLTVTAYNATKVYGTPNPTFSGIITGQQNGDIFTETYSTPATTSSDAGTYPIVPAASGPDLSAYTVEIVDGVLTITKAPVTENLTSSTRGEIQFQPNTLTATVQSTTAGTPTGTVQFLADGNAIGVPVTLSNGVAVLTTTALPVGVDTITAVYSGDQNFEPATATLGNTVTVTSADFTFTAPNGTTLLDTWGHQATLLLHVAPDSSIYVGTVTFSTVSQLPTLATASFAPSTVAATAGAVDVTYTYNSRLLSQNTPARMPWTPVVCGLVLLPLAASRRLRQLRGVKLLLVALLAAVLVPALSGCGSGYKSGTYPITVTATDGVHTHSITLTLDLNAP
jgi:hypothetical protein